MSLRQWHAQIYRAAGSLREGTLREGTLPEGPGWARPARQSADQVAGVRRPYFLPSGIFITLVANLVANRVANLVGLHRARRRW